ncbi:MAG: DUF3084 domain-containing protein [Gomphosphaeria aponina SAG 52.96 = DSM 107014]|uniref:DUF3084 domain-containing protein n=1 Tax=Gomphosphaeria aponina SAG 52.96 = DSM 107014 TaxID=1521640 RepID=A0A941GVC3_9CHRO|nr:DUF3084 domain-containing protein [Gomphosphaeria aponina SAG 52.96 = DSM 107014]
MTSAYILIAAILVLGGLIAAIGDRLGSKVGKARLRLFNLRPRQTAIVVTVLTGTIISASTLMILFSLSESLRQGVFELDDILKKRREVKKELTEVIEAKNNIEGQLQVAQAQAKEIEQNFQNSTAKLKMISAQAGALRKDVNSLLSERQQLENVRNDLLTQITQQQELVKGRDEQLARQKQRIISQDKILAELANQQKNLQAEIASRDNLITELDQEIKIKDQELQAGEARLTELESQLKFLQGEVEILEEYYQDYQQLRESTIAIVRGQVLAFGVVRIIEQTAVTEVIDRLLRQANRQAIEIIKSDVALNERVVQITKAQVEQLKEEIQDGQEYVVRIISAGNYVQGEKNVRVLADVTRNEEVFKRGEEIATVSLELENILGENLQEKIDLLLSVAKLNAQNERVYGEIKVEDGDIITLIRFLEKLKKYGEDVDEIKAVAAETASRAGPLKLRLIATGKGKFMFSTK